MTQPRLSLIPLAAGLRQIGRSRSTYYAQIDPNSDSYDADLPLTISLGRAPNSPRAFVQTELDAYVAKLIERARSPEAKQAAANARQHARRLVNARRAKSAGTPDAAGE